MRDPRIRAKCILICWLSLVAAVGDLAVAQSFQQPTTVGPEVSTPTLQGAPSPVTPGARISGTVMDQDGDVVANAKIVLSRPGLASNANRETLSDTNGYFVFAGVTSGPFQLSVAAPGFAPLAKTGVLQGEDYIVTQIALLVAPADVNVEVKESQEQVAEDQVKVQEKQRLFGVIPNYYVSYVPNAAPLTTKLKFQLAWKSTVDPVSFGITGVIAGIEQAQDTFGGYGQGMQGYAKRYGAAYGDFVSGTFIGGAILPAVLKQDPRYFWKGTGGTKSRVFYAIANSVICKGDNGRWQPNYSGIIGGLAAGGISNLYYPAQDRNGAALTFENALIGTGFGALGNIVQEFFLRKITPHVPDQTPAKD